MPQLNEVQQLVTPDLSLDTLHFIVPDNSDAMVVLTALAAGSDEDPRALFEKNLLGVSHYSVAFSTADESLVTITLPDLTLQCRAEQVDPEDRTHTALRIESIGPHAQQPAAHKILTLMAKSSLVTAANGVASDTFRLLDWKRSSNDITASPLLFTTLELIDKLENEERTRAQAHRVRFVETKEYYRCKGCRAFWQPGTHTQCPSCGRVFSDAERTHVELGKVEFSVPKDEKITLTQDMAVLIEPDDDPSFVGRVSKVDNRRHRIEVTCRSYEHAGTEGVITPSYNKALYMAKRSTLASLASKDFGVGLLAQLLVDPASVSAPSFVPAVDDMSWLTPGMSSNPPQNRAVQLVSQLQAGQVVFIQGPPGTGKTTVIVEAIKRRLAANPDERILVTSHSNLAVDNALERLAGTAGMRAVRVARAERVNTAVDQFRCDDEDDPRLLEANCYFATCATAATSGITDMNFDLVILDEANKARVDEALPSLRLGSALAMVGDHRQLPPVEDDSLYAIVEANPALEDIVNRSFFEQCWDGGVPEESKCLLTIQHRMHPQIARYISDMSYDGQLQNAPEVEAYDFVTRNPFPVALHFVDTANMRGGEQRGPGGALRNDLEVRVAAHVVRVLDERCPRELSMAIIAMYAEQVERLRQALGKRKFKRPVKIDTVDSFEGREEDIVVISLVRSNEKGRIGFLRVPNRLNVAISRSKRLVACIGDSATLRSGEETMYGVLVDEATECGGLIDARDLLPPAKRQHRPNRNPQRTGPGDLRRANDPQHPVPEGEGGSTDADGAALQRRRRHRRRRHGPRPLGVTGETTTVTGDGVVNTAPLGQPHGEGGVNTATPGQRSVPGEGAAKSKRRRRRRRPSQPPQGEHQGELRLPIEPLVAEVQGERAGDVWRFRPGTHKRTFRPDSTRPRIDSSNGDGPPPPSKPSSE